MAPPGPQAPATASACGGVRRLRQLRGGAQPRLAPRRLGGRQARREVGGLGGFSLGAGGGGGALGEPWDGEGQVVRKTWLVVGVHT